MFSSNQFLRLKASLDTHLGKKINECLDKDFDTFSLDEQVQMNKELGAKFKWLKQNAKIVIDITIPHIEYEEYCYLCFLIMGYELDYE